MMFVKRQGFETQRAKPWHIRRGDQNMSLCGNLKYEGWFLQWVTFVPELPAGQIICTICERSQKKTETK